MKSGKDYCDATGKERFGRLGDAERAAKALGVRSHTACSAYRCDKCHGWHITHYTVDESRALRDNYVARARTSELRVARVTRMKRTGDWRKTGGVREKRVPQVSVCVDDGCMTVRVDRLMLMDRAHLDVAVDIVCGEIRKRMMEALGGAGRHWALGPAH